MMQILVRVDASVLLGAGHAARCLALAIELKRRGHQVVFVMRALPGNLITETRAQSFEVLALADLPSGTATTQADWIAMAGEVNAQALDAAQTLNALPHRCWDWVVVDHYAMGVYWHNAVRVITHKLLVVDDQANRPLQCDVFLNQNLGASITRYSGLISPDSLGLLGPTWALLRPEFSSPALISGRDQAPSPPRVLVSLGGADAPCYALQILQALADCGVRGGTVKVVAGAANPHALALEQLCRAFGFEFLASTQAMAQLMARSDWAVGAGGVSLLERCSMGLPSIAVSIAQNQQRGVDAAGAYGAVIALNPEIPGFAERLRQAIQVMLTSPEQLKAMSGAGRAICDAKGAARVVDVLQAGALTLSPAKQKDEAAIYNWRNAPQTRRYSGDGQAITREQHHQWLKGVLDNPERRLWIASIASGPVGVLRFDRSPASVDISAEISVYRVPGQQSTGWGKALISRGIQEVQMLWPDLQRIDARISSDNLESLKAFADCGFEETAEPGRYQKTIQKVSL